MEAGSAVKKLNAVTGNCIDCDAPLTPRQLQTLLNALKVRLLIGERVEPIGREDFCCTACWEQRQLGEGGT